MTNRVALACLSVLWPTPQNISDLQPLSVGSGLLEQHYRYQESVIE
jgi:hypothetical protein